MIRIGIKWPLVALLVGAALFGSGPPAHAGPVSPQIEIKYSIDGGALQSTGGPVSSSMAMWASDDVGGLGLFKVWMTYGRSNAPGDTQALVKQGSAGISALWTDPAQTHTLTIFVSATGFTSPQSPPPLILATSSAIDETSGFTKATFTSYADARNGLFGGVRTDGSLSPMSTSVTYSVSGQQGAGADSSRSDFEPNGLTYSLSNAGAYEMTAGTSINIVGSSTTATSPNPPAMPAPAGLVLALTGAPVLGLGYWLRRRRARARGVALALCDTK